MVSIFTDLLNSSAIGNFNHLCSVLEDFKQQRKRHSHVNVLLDPDNPSRLTAVPCHFDISEERIILDSFSLVGVFLEETHDAVLSFCAENRDKITNSVPLSKLAQDCQTIEAWLKEATRSLHLPQPEVFGSKLLSNIPLKENRNDRELREKLEVRLFHLVRGIYSVLEDTVAYVHDQGLKKGSERLRSALEVIATEREKTHENVQNILVDHKNSEASVSSLVDTAQNLHDRWMELQRVYQTFMGEFHSLCRDLDYICHSSASVPFAPGCGHEQIDRWVTMYQENQELHQQIVREEQHLRKYMSPVEKLSEALSMFEAQVERSEDPDEAQGSLNSYIRMQVHLGNSLVMRGGELLKNLNPKEKDKLDPKSWAFISSFAGLINLIKELDKFLDLDQEIHKEEEYQTVLFERAKDRLNQETENLQDLLEERQDLQAQLKAASGFWGKLRGKDKADNVEAKLSVLDKKISNAMRAFRLAEAKLDVGKPDFSSLKSLTQRLANSIDNLKALFLKTCRRHVREDGSLARELELPDLFSEDPEERQKANKEEPFRGFGRVTVSNRVELIQVKKAYNTFYKGLYESYRCLHAEDQGFQGEDEISNWGLEKTLTVKKDKIKILLKKDLCYAITQGEISPAGLPLELEGILGKRLFNLITSNQLPESAYEPNLLLLLGMSNQEAVNHMEEQAQFVKKLASALDGAPPGDAKKKLQELLHRKELEYSSLAENMNRRKDIMDNIRMDTTNT